jgi:hypothetical protein
MFFLDLFSVEYKFFCPNSAENTMENRAISLVESSRDDSLIACPTSSGAGGISSFPFSRAREYRLLRRLLAVFKRNFLHKSA